MFELEPFEAACYLLAFLGSIVIMAIGIISRNAWALIGVPMYLATPFVVDCFNRSGTIFPLEYLFYLQLLTSTLILFWLVRTMYQKYGNE